MWYLRLVMPLILLLCVVGVFAVNNSVVDLWIMLVSGIGGYFLRKLDFSVAPLVLALVIGPMMENALRQSLMLSLGSFDIFFTQPLSRALFVLAGIILISPFLWRLIKSGLGRKKSSMPDNGPDIIRDHCPPGRDGFLCRGVQRRPQI